ncbi:hypothetical protein [Aquimonas sp.]|jgi:hypothetical protein|uniref:hypothetical protein n=1 Tax=Aquimonas sp. TaxID=1872588 RepID=UPI0037BE8E5F
MEASATLHQSDSIAFGDLLGEPRKLKTLTPEDRAARNAFFGRRVDATLRRGAARDLILSGKARYARIEGDPRPRRIGLVLEDKTGETILQLEDSEELGLFVSLERIGDAYANIREAQITCTDTVAPAYR